MSQSESKTTRVTLKDLGARLPLGVLGPDGKLHRELVCKRWRGREEREVGQMRAESRDSGNFPTRLLAYMFERIGCHDFASMSMAEREVVVSQLFLGDALYAYVWLRTRCVGTELAFDMTCPACSFEFKYTAALDTLEVRTAEDLEAVKWTYELETPFDVRGEPAAAFELGPTRWATMEATSKAAIESGAINSGGAKLDIFQGCISSVVGRGPLVLTSTELDEMTKRDIERLAARIDEHEVGPDMLVSEKCPRCRRRFRASLDWDYSSFFENSSP